MSATTIIFSGKSSSPRLEALHRPTQRFVSLPAQVRLPFANVSPANPAKLTSGCTS